MLIQSSFSPSSLPGGPVVRGNGLIFFDLPQVLIPELVTQVLIVLIS